jgi:predicted nucleotidyltransferase/DNA-binding XRE family transcriptional regulator
MLAGLTQAQLAEQLNTTQSAVARLESGAVTPTVDTLGRLGEALELKFEVAPGGKLRVLPCPLRGLTLDRLRGLRADILRIAEASGVSNVRVFGSVARGEADARSDVDLLVDVEESLTGFDYFGRLGELEEALSDLLGRKVDVTDARSLGRISGSALRDAVPL